MRSRWLTLLIPCVLFLAACGSAPQKVGVGETVRSAAGREKANEVVLFSLGLINIDYRFGGKNPEAGLDCSGMVSYVFDQSVNLKLKGSAADIARRGRVVDIAYIQQRSMGTDVKLLAKTLPAVVRGRGAY